MTTVLKKWMVPVLAMLVLLALIAWMAGLFDTRIQPGVNEIKSTNSDEAVAVTSSEVTIIEGVPASVEASQATLISARIMARIEAINVRAGDNVKRGDVVLQLEDSDIKAQVRQAEAQIRSTAARLKEAKQTLDRVTELQANGVMSASELDKATANYTALVAGLGGARQALSEARTALSFTKILAPFDGRVVDRFSEPGDTAQPGKQLLALYNPLSLRVEAQVREHLALGLEVGQPLKVEIPSLNKQVEAVIEERVPAADPGSRSFLVKAGVPFDKNMLPGMYARLLVPAGTENQLLIPLNRVVHVGQLDLVWVYQDGHRYRRFVRIGNVLDDQQVEILAGLREGDLVLPAP